MRILGIDTSGYANAVGVVDDKRILADSVFAARTDSLEKIISNVDFVLRDAGLGLEDIGGIGVGLGPGSWTGIRVGVTVAKILAYSIDKPVVGVPTLEAIAYSTRNKPAQICSIIYAGTKDTVYAAFYHVSDYTVRRMGDYYVGNPEGLAGRIKEATILVGSEAKYYHKLIRRLVGSDVKIDWVEAVPEGAVVALLAAARLKRDESDDVLSLEPLYLKESTAKALQGRTQERGRVD